MDIAELGYRIDSRQAVTAERNLNRMTGAAGRAERGAGMLGRAALGMAASLGVAFSLGSAISQARQLDAAIGELSTLIPGATGQLEEMTRAAREFGVSFGTGSRSQVAAFYQAVSAGATNAAAATARVDAANRLAIGGASDLASSIGLLNTATNAYAGSNLTAADAADILFTGVRTGVTTMTELSGALGRAIPAAVAVGVEFDELVGAVSALTTQGQNTNIAVTSLTAALSQLTNPSQQAREIAQQLGIEFNATAVEALGLVGFMEMLVEATGGNQETMAQLFGSVEALRAVFSLAGQGGVRFSAIMRDMETRAGAADQAYEQMASRLSTRWNVIMSQAGEQVERVGMAILQELVPAIEAVVEVIENDADRQLRILDDRLQRIETSGSAVQQAIDGLVPALRRLLDLDDESLQQHAEASRVIAEQGPGFVRQLGEMTRALFDDELAARRAADARRLLSDEVERGVQMENSRLGALARFRAPAANDNTTQTTATARELGEAERSLERQLRIVSLRSAMEREVAQALLDAGLALDAQTEEAQNIRDLARQIYQVREATAEQEERIRDAQETAERQTQSLEDARERLAILQIEDETQRRITEQLVAAGFARSADTDQAREILEILRQTTALETQRAEQERARQATSGRLKLVEDDLNREFVDPLVALRNEMEERRRILEQAAEMGIEIEGGYQERLTQIQESYARARNDMMLSAGQEMFGGLSGMARQFAGEQSGIFKALFLAEQAFALSRAIINAQVALSQAAAAAPPPANIPLIAMAAAQTLPPIATIAATTVAGLNTGGSIMIGGHGGIDNNMLSINGVPTARVGRGERIEVIPRGEAGRGGQGGGNVQISNRLVIEDHTDGTVRVERLTEDRVRIMIAEQAPRAVARSISDPSSDVSGAVTRHTSARRVR